MSGTKPLPVAVRKSRFSLFLFLLAILALGIRESFVLLGVVDNPIRGDVREYLAYAWNLVQHGVYSLAPPQDIPPAPDAYRAPGYPWLLALCMWLRPVGSGWYSLALQIQVFLGALSVVLLALLARQWLSDCMALLAGMLLALWPHHIAATYSFLSELAFGCALLGAMLCLAKALDANAMSRRDASWITGASILFGYAYLINPLIALFPLLVASALFICRRRLDAVVLTLVFLVPVTVFGIRNELIPVRQDAMVGRATLNFVQGSWPEYQDAHIASLKGDAPNAIATMQQIGEEASLLQARPGDGIAHMAHRMTKAPALYARWYLIEKPLLLWDWNIRLGEGGVYFNKVRHSFLETNPFLRIVSAALRTINPALGILLLATALAMVLLHRSLRIPPSAVGTAGLVLYLTAIHAVFQAEPRYANAYRGLEAVMLASAASLLLTRWRNRATRVHIEN